MRIFDINPPPTEPVTLASTKDFLRVDHDNEDNLISDLIKLAREQVETHICTSLITRTQRLERSCPNSQTIYVNRYPLRDIEAVNIVTPNSTINVAPGSFRENIKARPAAIALTSGQSWLAAFPDAQGIEIDFVAGYGPSPEDVPMPIKQAMLLLIGQHYEHRGDDLTGFPLMVDALLMPYKGLRL